MKVTKGTLRRRFKRLKREMEDQAPSAGRAEFLSQSFKSWVKRHSDSIIERYSDRKWTETAEGLLEQ